MEQPRNDEMKSETEQTRTPETGVQIEPVDMCHDVTDLPPYNGNIIMDCDNFGSLTQFSEGKRMNLDQADAWSAMAHLCVAIAGEGNKEKTHFETSALLGIKVNELEILQMKRTTKKSKKDSLRLNGENAKNQRTRTSLMKASMMGKESRKKTRHKSCKVPTSESAMTTKQKKTVVRKCGHCRQPGHMAATCSMPKTTKRKMDGLLNLDSEGVEVPASKKIKTVK